jgi:replicative DNA helicase
VGKEPTDTEYNHGALMKYTQDIRSLVHTPQESTAEYVEYARRIKSNPGVTFGIPSIDKVMIPMRPGDVVGIIARPGHGKSTLAAYLARKIAKEVAQNKNECVVYTTFEQSTEEIEAFFQIDAAQYSVSDMAWGRVDMDAIITQSAKRANLPVFIIGRSITRRRQMARMTVDNVYRAIDSIEDEFGIKPVLVVFDYIQLVPVDNVHDRVAQVGEAIVRTKELGASVGSPIVCCVQADRGVDKKGVKIPTASDCQWASAIEQTCDKLFGIWRPSLTEDELDPQGKQRFVDVAGKQYPIKKNLLVVKMLKQRMESAGHVFALHFAPEYVRLAELEPNAV